MKRFVIAVTMLLFAVLICVCEFKAVEVTDTYVNTLEKIENFCKSGEYQDAYNLSLQINENWQQTRKILNKYLYHDYIDNISVNLSSLPIHTKGEDPESVSKTVEEIKIQLASLKESELPYMHNIL